MRRLLLAGIALCLAGALVGGMLIGCGSTTSDGGASGDGGAGAVSANEVPANDAPASDSAAPSTPLAASRNEAPATSEGEPIVIAISELSDQARFYPTTVNGLPVEVLAVKAPDGSYRTALNTCQVCYDSGYGYYVQEGAVLVCQNCYNEFPMSAVEIQSGGCNPVPILDQFKEVTDDTITIPLTTLEAARPFFENWKR